MTATGTALLLIGALAGGFVSGLAGFGTALMTLGIWLYVLPPTSAVQLVLICSIVAQSATLPSMWKRFNLSIIWPFIVGGLAGVPLGTLLIAHANPVTFKLTIGVLLLVFSAALHFNRNLPAIRFGGRSADGAVGFAGGILGGLAGLSGPLPILWATLRGWSKDERRGIYQLYNWAIIVVAFVLQLGSGLVETQMIWLSLIALPGTIAGTWLGSRVYHAMNDRNFGDAVLILLFISGLGLLWSSL
ncbi:MAG: uncharacterized protein V7634_2722 [Bradyrhizobium sp.]|jgi:uncharacterized membrane protein YfcA